MKYGHRLAIVAEIERIYPTRQMQADEVKVCKARQSGRSLKKSMLDTQNDESELKPEQTPKAFKSQKDKTSNHNLTSCDEASTVGIVTNMASGLKDNKSKNKFPNSFEEQKTSKDLPNVDKGQSGEMSSAEVLSFSVRKKSIRARPDNPVKYKALRNAKIRSGKSVRSDTISYLTRGAVVVINQIKGRSGRVVILKPNGEFKKVGWVTLYTHDRQQLMERLNYSRNGERMRMHMM